VDIKGLGNNINPIRDAYNRQKIEKKLADAKPGSDKLEISDAARVIQSSSAEMKNVEVIKERINSNYYNSDEVINKVADAILSELKGSK
jgi:negative regulator of flagellin synthesis FlgM